jgi:adenine-specific DNA-methyltransferase
MQLKLIPPQQALSKAYLKSSIQQNQIDLFAEQLNNLFLRHNKSESEENHKNLIADLLKNAIYKEKYEINTRGRIDLVIHNGRSINDSPGVLLEVKRQSNKSEMITLARPNSKALHELILYYLEERYKNNNRDIKHIIATNINEWYIFDATQFEKLIFENKEISKKYKDWSAGLWGVQQTDWFYSEVAKPFVENEIESLTAVYFNLQEFTSNETDNEKLSILFKLLSPQHLLKQPFANDSNILNRDFYLELLYILGLEETKDKSKKVIQRVGDGHRNEGSFLENTINILEVRNRLSQLEDPEHFGTTSEEQLFSVALELCITWLNRVLFLKLLEGQLVTYHKNDKSYRFLNESRIKDFDELNELFFEVLAVGHDQRSPGIDEKYKNIPYLNSSLFEETDLERRTITIAELKDRFNIPLHKNTVLKNDAGSKQTGSKSTLSYLFEFLDAYDFSSENKSIIQESNKTIINSSVLGLIFEKLNGYKEGSIFTPGFCTMYMSHETVRQAVITRFNAQYNWECQNFTDLYNKVNRIPLEESNNVFKSLRICDPAVGSGHLLVSVLNELISTKSELNILCDREGKILRGYEVVVENDELIITYENELFVYNYQNKESQRVQETLFHEKQTIIENSLFGVDINPKSVMICRLRLWIELLKNSFYTKESGYKHLETLPNIDINIKAGNSLVSRFSINDKYEKTNLVYRDKLKSAIDRYKEQVILYKSVHDKAMKRDIEKKIAALKARFREMVNPTDKDYINLTSKENELLTPPMIYSQEDRDAWTTRLQELMSEKEELQKRYDLKMKTLYGNSFEWRFEFPEVLDDDGKFTGFDVVIGNPPYIRQESISAMKDYLKENYNVFDATADLLTYFIELGFDILKKDGVFQFIVANKFSRANYGKTLRGFLAKNTTLTHYLDFNDYPVFEEAVVLAAILGFVKKHPDSTNRFKHFKVGKEKFDNNIQGYMNDHGLVINQNNLGDDPWTFENPVMLKIKNKVEAQGTQIKSWEIKISRGLITGFNEAFVIENDIKQSLITADHKSKDILKPILRGRDIQKYTADFQNLWLINTHNGYKTDNHDKIDRIIVENYPEIYKHLLNYDEQLKKRSDQGATPYNLRDCAYLEDFSKPKIIYPNMTKFLPFTLDTEGYFTNQKCFIMTGERLYYLVSFFNSWLFKFCFRENFPELIGGTRELSKVFFEKIPVKPITEEAEQPYKTIVQQIMTIKKADPSADISTQDAQLNKMIYEYYGITPEEQVVIEETVKGWMG